MAAKKGSGFASRTQPNGAQKQGSPRTIAEHAARRRNSRSKKERTSHHPFIPLRERDGKEAGGASPAPTEKNLMKTGKGRPRSASLRRVPLSDEEVAQAIRKKNEKRRSRYRAVHGKVVDWVDHWIEEGWLFVSIRFQDQTDLWLQFGAKIVTEEIDLRECRKREVAVGAAVFSEAGRLKIVVG